MMRVQEPHARRGLTALLAAVLVGNVGLIGPLGCDPMDIAPLPSPEEPDPRAIFTSSLELETTGAASPAEKPGLVAIVGLPHAVVADVKVRLTARNRPSVFAQATTFGSFAITIEIARGESLELATVAADGRESRSISLSIPEYVPQPLEPKAGVAGPGGAQANFQPAPPETDSDSLRGEVLPVVVALGNGTARLSAGAGFVPGNATLVIANLATGVTTIAIPTSDGAISVIFAAVPGDDVAFFTRSMADPSLTSPVKKSVIPKPPRQ